MDNFADNAINEALKFNTPFFLFGFKDIYTGSYLISHMRLDHKDPDVYVIWFQVKACMTDADITLNRPPNSVGIGDVLYDEAGAKIEILEIYSI